MNRGLPRNALTLIDQISAVNQVLDVFAACLCRCIIQILQDTARKLILAHLQGSLARCGTLRLSTQVDHQPRLLEVTEVARNVKRCVLIVILHIESLLDQLGDLRLEIFLDRIEFLWQQ